MISEIERPTANSARAVRTFAVPPETVLGAARRAVGRLPRWSVVSESGDGLRAVRKTRLLRFKDDVTIRVEPHEDGARAELTSSSRIGRGDMGQNPRNLGELLRAVEDEVGSGAG